MSERERRRFRVTGTVQGVGFRPFVFGAATKLGLAGWVRNGPDGVEIEVEGPAERVAELSTALRLDAPPNAVIDAVEESEIDVLGGADFRIVHTRERGTATVAVLPDLAACPQCVAEVFEPTNRRHRYPFTNCTDCGPRFSIIESLPYDRGATAMRSFQMCAPCRAEYEDPLNRRFHAQPNCCADCGPRLSLKTSAGEAVCGGEEALRAAAERIVAGDVVAVKGLGGFHLVVDATNVGAVHELRRRKRRPTRPFAVMASWVDASQLGDLERAELMSVARPIVLVHSSAVPGVAVEEVAPGLDRLGVFLPYTPLHHLLLDAVGAPCVATSANVSDEPIVYRAEELSERLHGVVDWVLDHDRPIVRPVEDAVVQVFRGAVMLLRPGRGFAPRAVVEVEGCDGILGFGGYTKATAALGRGGKVILGSHVGGLGSLAGREAYEAAMRDLPALHDTVVTACAHDSHPDWPSATIARGRDEHGVVVQHHHAHAASVMAEHGLTGEVFAAIFDGTGDGQDGTVWGGELLVASRTAFRRVGHLVPFRLLGGEAAVIEPARVALGLAVDAGVDGVPRAVAAALSDEQLANFGVMLERNVGCVETTSAGRLFDGVAALLGIGMRATYEAEPAILLEALARHATEPREPEPMYRDGLIDWRPLVQSICAGDVDGPEAAWALHFGLARAIVDWACAHEARRLALSGGCFQNRLLLELTVDLATRAGIEAYWNLRVPINDDGVSVGQVAVAAARRSRRGE